LLSREVIARIVKHSRAVEKPFFRPAAPSVQARSGIDGTASDAHAGSGARTCFFMATAVLIITLLTLAASLASWLFSQWLAKRARLSAAALAVGGGGAVVLIAAVAFVIVGAASGWQHWMPREDFSASVDSAATAARSSDAWPARHQPAAAAIPTLTEDPTANAERDRMRARKAELLASAESHLEQSEYKQAVDIAREYLALNPRDDDMLSMLARSMFAAQHPGPAHIIPAAVVAEWPATDCVTAARSDGSARWMLDNGCGRVVAVLFASCEQSETVCFTNALVSQGWSYEPAGILMTAANDRPVPLRLGSDGPLVAPIFTIRDAGNTRRQIRYLACEVTAPGVLQVLHESGGQLTQQRLAAELRFDECYAQVLAWSYRGQRRGASPDSLLRDGID
jgi:hypothetical protein